jgi:predicted lipid-binding transport protein (Tim44 family)
MTGSALAPIIIPIVALIALAAWLAMIFYAEAHPGHVRHGAASGSAATPTDGRGQDIRRELAPTGAGPSRRAAIAAGDGAGERAPSEPSRRAA